MNTQTDLTQRRGEAGVKPMVSRFKVSRWSTTRKAIHGMLRDERLDFPEKEYFNAQASVSRLNDAYGEERQWLISGGRKSPKVIRIR